MDLLPFERSSIIGLMLAGVFGFIFGMLLDRGHLNRYHVIVNFFRLKDFRMIKVMLTAIIVGGLGVWALNAAGLATYHIKSLSVAGVLIGGGLFGIGMVVLGYCPGTAVAALGRGSLHALIGLVGMIVGGACYGLCYPWVKSNVLTLGDYGKSRLMDLGLPEWSWWVIVVVTAGVIFAVAAWSERGTKNRDNESVDLANSGKVNS